jgi:hypothetical protein
VLCCWNFDFGSRKVIEFLLQVGLNAVTLTARDYNRSGKFYSHPIIQEILLDNLIPCLKSQSLYSFLIRKNNNIRNAN